MNWFRAGRAQGREGRSDPECEQVAAQLAAFGEEEIPTLSSGERSTLRAGVWSALREEPGEGRRGWQSVLAGRGVRVGLGVTGVLIVVGGLATNMMTGSLAGDVGGQSSAEVPASVAVADTSGVSRGGGEPGGWEFNSDGRVDAGTGQTTDLGERERAGCKDEVRRAVLRRSPAREYLEESALRAGECEE